MATQEDRRHRGEPHIPEERKRSGHDSQPDPAPVAPPDPSGSHAAPLRGSQSPSASSDLANAKFIADNFEVTERKAAELIVGSNAAPGERSSLAASLHRARKQDDALSSVPTPDEPRDDLVADSDETALKPVLHTPVGRTR